MASILWSIIGKLGDLSYDLVLKHLCYIVNAGKNVRAMNNEMQQLRQQRVDIDRRIEREERDGTRKRTAVAEGWIEKVEECEGEVKRIKDNYDGRVCIFCEDCSFNCWSNYRIGMDADERCTEVKELLNEGKFSDGVTQEQLPPAVQVITMSSRAKGLESNLEIAIQFLEEDENFMLGIWGVGGVGKSSLLAEINNFLAQDVLGFHHVIMVVASHGCTTEKIQEQIIEQLKLHEENGTSMRTRMQAAIITNYLIQKNFVLLLDDVWEPLDLAEVGIPHPHCVVNQPAKHWKVIMVSRDEAVCSQMEAYKKIHVECLKAEDAWHLFEEKVGKATIKSHHSIRELAEKIVQECGGLPLALVTIGHAMSSKKTPQAWRHALSLLQRSQHISGTKEKLFIRLKLSYDCLGDDRMRECFLCCSLWPEDHRIEKDELIECWMGHGLIDDFHDITEAYQIGHDIIESLQGASLLEAGHGHYVKMHDVIRDMALWIANECGATRNKWMVSAGLELQEAPQEKTRWTEAHKISLMHNRIEALPSTIDTDCHHLTTLMLQSNNSFNKELTCLKFFRKLKYLDLTCCSLHYFPMEICSMVGLEYLDLSRNKIESLPGDTVNLKSLKYLRARRCRLSIVPQGFISSLAKLVMLDIDDAYPFEVNQGLILEQLDCIEGKQLKAVGINVSSFSDFEKLAGIPITHLGLQGMEGETSLPLLSSQLLTRHNIQYSLKELVISYCSESLEQILIEGDNHLEFLELLKLSDLPGLKEVIWKAVDCKNLFPALTEVRIHDCNELKHASWVRHLLCLEKLDIQDCRNMKKVIDEEVIKAVERPIQVHVPKHLILRRLPKLASICSSAFTFPSLEYLWVSGCPELKKLPFGLHSGDHANLKQIDCDEEWWEGLYWNKPDIKTLLLPLYNVEGAKCRQITRRKIAVACVVQKAALIFTNQASRGASSIDDNSTEEV